MKALSNCTWLEIIEYDSFRNFQALGLHNYNVASVQLYRLGKQLWSFFIFFNSKCVWRTLSYSDAGRRSEIRIDA